MLLKYTQAQKRIKATGIGKPQRTAGGMVKLTSGLMTVMPKIHRKVIKVANKRPTAIHRPLSALKREQISLDPCENSNDSGLGFDHHLDYHTSLASHSALRFSDKETAWQIEESPEVKRRRLEIKLESDDANDNFTFQEAVSVRPQLSRTICIPVRGRSSRMVVPVTLTSQLSASSHSGLSQLLIVCQPEQQHRARYQTEGSRGAVKDRTGNGFPVVKLVGYDRPTTLQVFIGTDQGRVAPHMFYQACRVSGKNSTPCVERKIDGTIVIEVDVEPSKDMVVTCDCVGILKERNVDVEHRFPEEGTGRSKKKSTRCRMVFRTTIANPDGTQETLQVTSQPIVCTQPPGVPEICKKSLTSCGVRGGQELFILGKNFLKDTRVVFQEGEMNNPIWTQSVQPDKEFLQQSHLVCVVPPYRSLDVSEPVSVRLVVESSGKASEPHSFVYLPLPLPDSDRSVLATGGNIVSNSVITQVKFLKGSGAYRGPLLTRRRYRNGGSSGVYPPHLPMAAPLLVPVDQVTPQSQTTFLAPQTSPGEEKPHPVMLWEKPSEVMMPPPPGMLPIAVRRSSLQMIVPDPLPPENLKRELPDPPKPNNVTDLSSTQSPSMDTFHKFVSNNSLPSINVGNYLSNIEANSIYSNKVIKPQIMNELPRIVIPSPTIINKPLYQSDSPNLLTPTEPVLGNQSIPVSYEGRRLSGNNPPNSHSPQENISVIVNNSGMPKNTTDSHVTQELQLHKQMSETQNVAINLLIPSTMNKQTPTMTEGLDAFVNSAADSHISPTPSMSPENTSINSSSEMVVNRTNEVQPVSPCTSAHNDVSMNEGALSSLISHSVLTPPVTTTTQAVAMSSIQASLEHHMTPSQVIQASIEQHISPPQISQNQLNCLIQSSTKNVSSQAQTLSEIQTTLEQELSSHPVSPIQIENSNLSRMIQSSPQLPVSLEQTLPPQNLSSTEFSNLMQSSSQNSTDQARSLTNLQVTLGQLTPQQVCPPQIIHTESVQTNNMTMNEISSTIHTSGEVQSLSNLEASLECHLPPQVINSPQNESLVSGITSSQIQASVREAQVISSIQATFEQHIKAHNMLESMSSCSSSRLSSPNNTTSDMSVSQPSGLSNLQMALGHISPQQHLSNQTNHESLSDALSLNNSIPSSQISVATSEAEQALSNFKVSLEHHLSSQVMGGARPTAESLMPLDRLNVSVHTPQHETPNQSLSHLQVSINQLSSQVLNSAPQTHDSHSNNSTINDLQSVTLRDPLAVMNTQQISVVTSANSSSGPSHLNPTSVLTSTERPVPVSAPTMHNTPSIEVNSSNLVINGSQNMLTTELTLANPTVQTLASCDVQVQNSQNMTLQCNSFQQNPVQETADQYKQHGCITDLKNHCEKKDSQGYGMSGQAPQQVAVQSVKKCEEGIPLPHELTQMSEHDLISYINPSCFDTV